MPRAPIACVLVAWALLLAGCGGSAGPGRPATLVLDFTPNAVHAGIYSTLAGGFDRAAGVRLDVRQPSSSTDSVKLLLSGRADFAVLDIHDLAIARAAGRDIVGVLALVARPLAAVLAGPGVRTPRELAGRLVGVTGVPSDDAVLRSVVAGGGGDPARVREVTIGFNAVPALLGGHVAAATAFWDVEGVALRRRRPGIHEFRVDDYGAPAYPELVLSMTGKRLRSEPKLAAATIAALRRGYAVTVADPERSAADELARVPGLDRTLLLAELAALRGAFTAGPGQPFGAFDLARLRAWARWEARFGIVNRVPDAASMFAGAR
ncbi:MAG: putative hydroxymethylpyrimidine transport system substrate-binding protein [Solirubrobacteraceae bacterium]|jgi:ABC-type nitrate/sulfonate/bicarbonate transport system substrate-binding protein|nr:putative hydroxymethylpyrimidine transport system substrate-binding protein [Solirubrobacteraceae bacterium]